MGGDFRSNSNELSEDLREELFANYVDRLMVGGTINMEQISEAHPDLSDEFLTQLRAFANLASTDDDLPARNLGDYTLMREVGRGGMGVVYEAWQNSLKCRVALKVLRHTEVGQSGATRFIREAQAAGKL